MKNFKKIMAMTIALSSVMSLAACSDGGSSDVTTAEITTTTAKTVAIKDETLAAEEQ